MKSKEWMLKAPPELKKLHDEVRIQRLKDGKNKTLLSYKRLTLAMCRIPNIKKVLLESEIKDGK